MLTPSALQVAATSAAASMGAGWCAPILCAALVSRSAYGLFNSMNLQLVTAKLGQAPAGDSAYVDAILMALGGPLGALLGAALVDTRLGRKGTLITGVVTLAASSGVFIAVGQKAGVILSGAFIQLTAQIMYSGVHQRPAPCM